MWVDPIPYPVEHGTRDQNVLQMQYLLYPQKLFILGQVNVAGWPSLSTHFLVKQQESQIIQILATVQPISTKNV